MSIVAKSNCNLMRNYKFEAGERPGIVIVNMSIRCDVAESAELSRGLGAHRLVHVLSLWQLRLKLDIPHN
jgi:hypothetical protein